MTKRKPDRDVSSARQIGRIPRCRQQGHHYIVTAETGTAVLQFGPFDRLRRAEDIAKVLKNAPRSVIEALGKQAKRDV